jgi:hypothetical protein
MAGAPVGGKAKIFDFVESVGFQSDADANGHPCSGPSWPSSSA